MRRTRTQAGPATFRLQGPLWIGGRV